MLTHTSHFPSFPRQASLAALFLLLFTIISFFGVSAKKETAENSAEQSLVLGRLAYATLTGTFGSPEAGISTANADGTGVINLTNFPPVSDPAWSPDGRIVYVRVGAGLEIFVMNADGTNQINLSNTVNISESNPSWSVTGKIVYERGGQIWVMNADGTNQIQFAGITQAGPTDPIWSSDGGKIAFVSGGEIWKINANGTNELRVTTNATTDLDPAWSPDGAKIIFAKGGSGIAVVGADGTNEVPLTNVAGDANPVWSPDGTVIAFRREGTLSGIYLMDVIGGNQVRIIADTTGTTGTTNNSPAWQPIAQSPNTFIISGRITRSNVSLGGVTVNLSGTTNATATTDGAGNYQFSGLPPGGSYAISPSFPHHYFAPPNRSFNNLNSNQIADFTASGVCVGLSCVQNGKIAFVREPDIFTMNQDGTNQTNITNSAGSNTSPNYSPDGTKIIFSTSRDGNNEIYRMDADGSNPMRLTNNSASDTKPYYSPDGLSIVFISNRDGNNEIYKMNSDGTNQVRLTNDSVMQDVPAFSPDGQKIIYVVVSNQLWLMNADGTNQQQFQNPPGPSHYYNHPSYSPNGQKIIFRYGDDITSQKTWTMNADGTNRIQVSFGGFSPSYSPDGLQAVGSGFPNSFTGGIYTSNVNGTDTPLRITTGPFDALPDWQPVLVPRRGAFDFDGDGRSDISVFRPSSGFWYLLRSTSGFSFKEWGLSSDLLAPADYDGDLKTDLAVWRPSDGNFYVINSFDNTFREENFGLTGDVPTGGDWDGDGKADVAVYREGGPQHGFHYRGSMGNPNGNISSIPWGVPGDKPVVGDYDGDGRTDAAVFRPSTGTWYVRNSSNGATVAVNFGSANDKLVPADYDGDGKTDVAVFRDGIWYLLRSAQGFTGFQFGSTNDIPAPADYDGDGRADAAIYRDGVWWILDTQTGAAQAVQFGLAGDVPIPSAFVR